MITTSRIELGDLQYREVDEGDSVPSFTHTLAEHGSKRLVAEVFLKADFPAVLFCIYVDGEGEYAGNTLVDAVDHYNAIPG